MPGPVDPSATHVDPLTLPFHPIPPSASPTQSVKLTLLHTGSLIAKYVQFLQRETEEEMRSTQEEAAVFAWVVEKDFGGGRVERWLWDAGIVSDKNKLGPAMAAGMDSRFIFNVPPSAQLPELLTHLSPAPATVQTLTGILLSHAHVDHYGALDEFPPDLPVVVGPGTRHWIEGSPEGQGPMPRSFWEHARVKEEVGEGDVGRGRGREWVKVGAYEKAWDWFGDGSMWLCQAPGHCPGHMVALCRVSTSPDTYVLLGGDTCHSRAIYAPYPSPSSRGLCACFHPPSSHSSSSHSSSEEKQPGQTMHTDLAEAYRSIARLTRMEMEENVLSVLAHETEFAKELGLEVGGMKGGWERWKEEGWKDVKRRNAEAARAGSGKGEGRSNRLQLNFGFEGKK